MSNTAIQQPQTPIPPPTHLPLAESGIFAALGVWAVKEFVAFFKKKDASEDELIRMLIEDMRRERAEHFAQQNELLGGIKTSHDDICRAIATISAAITDINMSLQQSKRTETEILYAIRENQQAVLLLNEKVDRFIHQQGNYGIITPAT